MINPQFMEAQTNKAHALMFLGKTAEARAVYTKFKGQEVPSMRQKWEAVILDDFSNLEKNGLSNPLMTEVRSLFAPSRSAQNSGS